MLVKTKGFIQMHVERFFTSVAAERREFFIFFCFESMNYRRDASVQVAKVLE